MEIDRQWPTQVDQVALHPRSMPVTDQTDFATFPLAATEVVKAKYIFQRLLR